MHAPQKEERELMRKAGETVYFHRDFEVTGLAVPRPANRNMSMAMYSDRNAQAKKKPVNARATALVRGTGHFDRLVYGDAFVGRAFDGGKSNW